MTDEQIKQLCSIQRDAAIGVRGDTVAFFNAAAQTRFPDLTVGEIAAIRFPSAVLEAEETTFSASALVDGNPYTVLGTQIADLRVYTLIPQEEELDGADGQLLERVCGTMRRTLTVLNMATEFLAPAFDQMEEPKQKANLTIISKTNYQLQRLCDNLDSFFHLSAGQARLFLDRVDLVVFCRDLAQSVDHFAKRLLCRVRFQTDCDQLMASVDRQKMTKLLLNLLSNSLKHLNEGGSVSLDLGRQGEDAVFTIRDTGLGIAPGDMGQVFTRYQSSCSDTDTKMGVGLGLNIAQEIARLHGGTLFVTSQEGRGTAVCLRLPIRQDADTGLLQETSLPYGEGDGGMHPILTELSDVLDDGVFLGRYY